MCEASRPATEQLLAMHEFDCFIKYVSKVSVFILFSEFIFVSVVVQLLL